MEELAVGCGKPTGAVVGALEATTAEEPAKIEEVSMVTAKIGAKAPDFEAPAFLNGKFVKVKLSDHLGKWVVLCFYPGDFTFVWPTELAAVAAKAKALQELDAVVIAVSVDSQFVHKVWQQEELSKMVEGGFPFAMVADSAGRIGSVYGCYDEAAGVNTRGRFIIDPDGAIQAIEILTPPVGRNVDELIRQLQAFQMVRKTKGAEAAPSGWSPGKQTLKPGPEIVGKVWKEWKVDLAF